VPGKNPIDGRARLARAAERQGMKVERRTARSGGWLGYEIATM
jgi:hypothetical protein